MNDILLGKKKSSEKNLKKVKKMVLLIDEVDVFFDKTIFGSLFMPQMNLKHEKVRKFIYYIWENRFDINLEKVGESEPMKQCRQIFQDTSFIIFDEVKKMLEDLKTYSDPNQHSYMLVGEDIGYFEKSDGSVNIKRVDGYKTMWAYYDEVRLKTSISEFKLTEKVGMKISCGNFSFAEFPKLFEIILGVTGTLDTLTEVQKKVINKEYKITHKTIIPSVFGENKRVFRYDSDVILTSDDGFNVTLIDEIKKSSQEGASGDFLRPVLVFFKNQTTLENFRPKAEEMFGGNLIVINLNIVDAQERNLRLRASTGQRKVTLLTREFGRGIDFISRNKEVNKNGGLSVISTFLSKDLSEQIQIFGRVARQGEPGNCKLVLSKESLIKIIPSEKEIDSLMGKKEKYKTINDRRETKFEENQKKLVEEIKNIVKVHEKSMELVKSLDDHNIREIYKSLNLQRRQLKEKHRTLLLVDATGSMSEALDLLKNSIRAMLLTIKAVVKKNNYPENLTEIQIAFYRNYNSQEDQILEVSPWHSEPSELSKFLDDVICTGGWGEEAIEIGLWHANQQENLAQIILMGDAPPNNSLETVIDKRKRGPKIDEKEKKKTLDWDKTRFPLTYFENEVVKLKEKLIPIHSILLKNDENTKPPQNNQNKSNQVPLFERAQKVFGNISNNTFGTFKVVEIKAQNNTIEEFIIETIIKDIGVLVGKEEEFAKSFDRNLLRQYF